MKRTVTVATCAAAAMLTAVLTGCSSNGTSSTGSSHDNSSGGANGTAAAATAATAAATAVKQTGQATVATKSVGKVGTILVDGKGRTLYLFMADKKNKSTCTGSCAVAWPPLLTVGAVKPGTGANAKLLATAPRTHGAKQATYNGHPLYYYVGDSAPGQTNGQGLNQFGALWYVVNAKGKQVTS